MHRVRRVPVRRPDRRGAARPDEADLRAVARVERGGGVGVPGGGGRLRGPAVVALPRRRADDLRRRPLGAARPEHQPRPQPEGELRWPGEGAAPPLPRPARRRRRARASATSAGIDFETRLVTEPEGVDQLPGSIYHNLAQPKALELLHELEGRYVLVAIPCQLEGIFSYIRTLAPELADKVHTTIGLLCGWQYSHHALAGHRRLQEARPRRGHRHLLPRRGARRAAAHVDRRRGARGRPAGRLQLPGRLRPVVQHPALPHLRQPLELPRRHRRGRRLVAVHGVVDHRRVAARVPHRGHRRGGAGARGARSG